MKRRKLRSHCPVNFGLELFGDKWTLLILRDIVFRGKKSYGEFLKSEEGFATNLLASRLEMLIDSGILEKSENQDDARTDIFRLTQKGLDLIPLLFEMVLWSAKYDPQSEAKKIPELIRLIEKDNRSISKISKGKVKSGRGIVFDYIQK
ncbi:MAG: helix-turn-helix transcriptional regulator [Bdellovibrionales bacterium]|nr:helix-turn-helix transcriptional regulator [Bdellovibrionales bacterium]